MLVIGVGGGCRKYYFSLKIKPMLPMVVKKTLYFKPNTGSFFAFSFLIVLGVLRLKKNH